MTLSVFTEDNHTQLNVPLSVKPKHEFSCPSYFGKHDSNEHGIVQNGFHSMDYELPGGALLKIIANYHSTKTQVILLTKDSEIFKQMPGYRPGSMVAEAIAILQKYRLRKINHVIPRESIQSKKISVIADTLEKLETLLEEERSIGIKDFIHQESFRHKIIKIIRDAQQKNYQLANHPMGSDGELGSLLLEARHEILNFHFNHFNTVTRLDQLDFSAYNPEQQNAVHFVWDSKDHLKNDGQLEEAIQQIYSYYKIDKPEGFSFEHPTRIERFFEFFKTLKKGISTWLKYIALEKRPHTKKIEHKEEGDFIIKNYKPFYHLEGEQQLGYENIAELVEQHLSITEIIEKNNIELAKEELRKKPGACVLLPDNKIIYIKNDKYQYISYFKNQENRYLPLPSVEDLMTLAQMSRRHLFFFDRFALQMRTFITQLGKFFLTFYRKMKSYLFRELVDNFSEHVHSGHDNAKAKTEKPKETLKKTTSLNHIINRKGITHNGKNYQDILNDLENNKHLVRVIGEHLPTPPTFENPLHRIFNFMEHFSHLFIDPMEKNPLIGTLAMAAYFFGGSAVMAPAQLTALLKKMHVAGLIKGSKPTQDMANMMSQGELYKAISASLTLWQGMMTAPTLDQFIVDTLELVKDNPAEVFVVSSLAMLLGATIVETIPSFRNEVGVPPFNLLNYAAAGVKGGAAIYDTVMHPGDDWLLGTCKWIIRIFMSIVKFFVSPFVEWWHYGFRKGFLTGCLKSLNLLALHIKQSLATLADLCLISIKFLLNEVSTVLIQIPIRGLSSLLSKTMGLLGQWRPWGEYLMNLSHRLQGYSLFDNFRHFPNYGFRSPVRHYSGNPLINIPLNALLLIPMAIFQLVKNPILATLDTLERVVRFVLDLLIDIAKISLWLSGGALYIASYVWDPSFGQIFTKAAAFITGLNNIFDICFDELRQRALSSVNLGRNLIFRNIIETGPQDSGKIPNREITEYNQYSRYHGINFFQKAKDYLAQEKIEQEKNLSSEDESSSSSEDDNPGLDSSIEINYN